MRSSHDGLLLISPSQIIGIEVLAAVVRPLAYGRSGEAGVDSGTFFRSARSARSGLRPVMEKVGEVLGGGRGCSQLCYAWVRVGHDSPELLHRLGVGCGWVGGNRGLDVGRKLDGIVWGG
jgi:hypothetical protein